MIQFTCHCGNSLYSSSTVTNTPTIDVVPCPACGRLWVREGSAAGGYTAYLRENSASEPTPDPSGSAQVSTVRVRSVRPEDDPEWLRLRHALWPDESWEELGQELASVRADPRQPVFVAERPGGGLCGLIELSIHETAPGCNTTPVGYIEGWFVDPDWRGKGVGRLLVEAGEAWARALGFREMASDTDFHYPTSPLAHAGLGYLGVQGEIQFCKRLD